MSRRPSKNCSSVTRAGRAASLRPSLRPRAHTRRVGLRHHLGAGAACYASARARRNRSEVRSRVCTRHNRRSAARLGDLRRSLGYETPRTHQFASGSHSAPAGTDLVGAAVRSALVARRAKNRNRIGQKQDRRDRSTATACGSLRSLAAGGTLKPVTMPGVRPSRARQ